MSFNLFEAHEASGDDERREAARAGDKLAAAISDVREQFGDFLFQAADRGDFEDRVALCKDDMIRAVNAHLMPVTGTMRRVVRAVREDWEGRRRTAKSWTLNPDDPDYIGNMSEADLSDNEAYWSGAGGEETSPEQAAAALKHLRQERSRRKGGRFAAEVLEPEGDFHGYLDDVAPDAEGKAGVNFVTTGPAHDHDGNPADTDFAKQAGFNTPYGRGWQDHATSELIEMYESDPDSDEGDELFEELHYRAEEGDKDAARAVLNDTDVDDADWSYETGDMGEREASRRQAKGVKCPQCGKYLHDEIARAGHAHGPDGEVYDAEPQYGFESRGEYQKRTRGASRRVASTLAQIAEQFGMEPYELQDYADMNDADPNVELSPQEEGFLLDLLENSDNGVYEGGHPTASRRQAQGDPLGTAVEAITQELQEQAELFQQQIEPLQQALQAVDYAQQVQQAQQPMNVTPDEGTVQVIPDRNPVPQQIPQGGPQVMPGQMPGPADPNDPYGQAAQQQQVQARRRRAGYGAKSFDVAGYTYQGQNFEPGDLIEYMVANGDLSPAARDMNPEEVLDQHAGANAIDREDERSFDSDEFPKVIFQDQLDPEHDSDWYSGYRESRRRQATEWRRTPNAGYPLNAEDQAEGYDWLEEHGAEKGKRSGGPYDDDMPGGRNRKKAAGDVKVVYNKMLGGWYVVRGPHQTPLSGRFDSKEEAQASLRRKAQRGVPNDPTTAEDMPGWEQVHGRDLQPGDAAMVGRWFGVVRDVKPHDSGQAVWVDLGDGKYLRQRGRTWRMLPETVAKEMPWVGKDAARRGRRPLGDRPYGVSRGRRPLGNRAAGPEWGNYGRPQIGGECENCGSPAIEDGVCQFCGEGGPQHSDPKKWPANVNARDRKRREREASQDAVQAFIDWCDEQNGGVADQHAAEAFIRQEGLEGTQFANEIEDYVDSQAGYHEGGRRPFKSAVEQGWWKPPPGAPKTMKAPKAPKAPQYAPKQPKALGEPKSPKPKKMQAARSVGLIGGGNVHRPAGWEWDRHLLAFTSHAPQRFACSCGDELDMPGYRHCRCGKVWNGYAIARGGDMRTAQADTYLVREVPVRKDVVLASRRDRAMREANRRLAGDGDPGWYNDMVDNLGKKPSNQQKLNEARGQLKRWTQTNGGSYGSAQVKKLKSYVEYLEKLVARERENRQAGKMKDLFMQQAEEAGEDPDWWPSEVGQDSPKVGQPPVDWHRRDSGGKWTPPGVPAKKGSRRK